MTDTFNVAAAWDKPSYASGDVMKATISGTDVHVVTTTTLDTVGPITIPIVSSDGDQSTVQVPAVQVARSTTTTTDESVLIDTTVAIVDTGGRTWQVSADRLSITAVA